MSSLDWIALVAAAVVVLALARIVWLVPGFGDETVRPMSHAVVALGLGLIALGVSVLVGAPIPLWMAVPAGAMLIASGLTLTMVGRAAVPYGQRTSRARVGALDVRRR